MDNVLELFSEKWDLHVDQCRMLISVVGSHSSSFTIPQELLGYLSHGFRRVCLEIPFFFCSIDIYNIQYIYTVP